MTPLPQVPGGVPPVLRAPGPGPAGRGQRRLGRGARLQAAHLALPDARAHPRRRHQRPQVPRVPQRE